jgi:hypothetical protein
LAHRTQQLFAKRRSCFSSSTHLRVGKVGVLHRPRIQYARREVRPSDHGVLEASPVEAGILEGRTAEVAPLEVGLDQKCLVEAAALQVAAGKVGRLGDDYSSSFLREQRGGRIEMMSMA